MGLVINVIVIMFTILFGGVVMAGQGKPPLLGSPPSGGSSGWERESAIAVDAAKRAGAHLVPGKVWTMMAPRGETEIKAAVLYEGAVVAVLHFTPDGEVLPLGVPPAASATAAEGVKKVYQVLASVVSSLRVLDAAEYRDPESAWVVPLAYGNMIVAHIKVSPSGAIVPDYPAQQEMERFGR